MTKKQYIYISVITIIFVLFGGFYFITSKYSSGKLYEDKLSTSVLNKKGQGIPFIAYIPSPENNVLRPEVIDIDPSGDIYKRLIESLFKYCPEYFGDESHVTSATLNSSIMKVKLSSGFISDLLVDEDRFNLALMSIVNSLTEINGVDKVEIYLGKEKIFFRGKDVFKRNESLISREVFHTPDNVLTHQMKLEKKGEFLKAYLLMAPIHNSNRKMYHEYLAEMEEISEIGFLNGDFKIKNTVVSGKEAIVNVEFINRTRGGVAANSSVVPVKCILQNGSWFVQW